MEAGLQNILKSGLLVLATVAVPSLLTAAENTDMAEVEPLILQQRGQPQDYLSLMVEGTEVPATLRHSRLGKTYGKVLILHDGNGGIDSPGLIRTLRQGLSDAGWMTMTVALTYPREPDSYLSTIAASGMELAVAASEAGPTVSVEGQVTDGPEAPFPDNASRVVAALAYLEAQQPGATVVLTVGKAAQLISLPAGQFPRPAGVIWIRPDLALDALPEMPPVLDIAGETPGRTNERAEVRRVFMQRQAANYVQRRITGAGYGFYGFEKQVLSYVRGWLSKQFVGEADN